MRHRIGRFPERSAGAARINKYGALWCGVMMCMREGHGYCSDKIKLRFLSGAFWGSWSCFHVIRRYSVRSYCTLYRTVQCRYSTVTVSRPWRGSRHDPIRYLKHRPPSPLPQSKRRLITASRRKVVQPNLIYTKRRNTARLGSSGFRHSRSEISLWHFEAEPPDIKREKTYQ